MKRNKGVLTVEAALVVPLFIFAILFMTQFMKIVYVYDTVQANVYNTAKFINGYSYVADGVNDDVQNMVTEVQGIFSDATNIDISEDLKTFMNNVAQKGVDAIEKGIVTKIAKVFLEKELQSVTGNSNYQQDLGIIGDFDFKQSKVSAGMINIIVTYKLKVSVPFFDIYKDGIEMKNQVYIENLAS